MEEQIQHYLSRLNENPSDLRAMGDLEQVFAARGQWSEFARFLSHNAEQAGSPGLRERLLLKTGEVVGFRLGDTQTAEMFYQQALSEATSPVTQLDAQAGLLSLNQEWEQALEVYKQSLQIESTKADHARSLYNMGIVYRDQFNDLRNAIELFRKAFELENGLFEALRAARGIFADIHNWTNVIQLFDAELRHRIHRKDFGEVAQILAEKADVFAQHLEQPDEALKFYTKSLEIDPNNAQAQAGLQRLQNPDAVEEDAVEELAPAEVVEVIEEVEAVEAAAPPAPPEAPPAPPEAPAEDMPSDAFVEAAEAVEEAPVEVPEEVAAEPAEEAPVEEAVAVEEPTDEVTEEAPVEDEPDAPVVEDEAPATPEEVAVAEEVVVEDEPEVAEVADESQEVAEVVEDAVADEALSQEEVPSVSDEQDVEAEEAAVEEAPVEEEPAEEEVPGWKLLADDYLDMARENPEGPEALDASRLAMDLFLKHNSQDPALLEATGLALAAVPGHDVYSFMRARLDDDTWRSVLKVYTDRYNGADDAERNLLRIQMGRISLFELGDIPTAQDRADALEGVPEAEEFTHELAQVKNAASGGWRQLQSELTSQFNALKGPERNAAVYGRIAEVARALRQDNRELDARRRQVQSDSTDVAARHRLKALYRDAKRWKEYADLLKADIQQSDDPEEQVAIHRMLVPIYRDQIRQDAAALQSLQAMHELAPDDDAIVEDLAAQLEKMRRFPDLIKLLNARVQQATTPKQTLQRQLGVALLYRDKVNNQGEAIKAFEAVLELDPANPDALAFLKQMYERRRDYPNLIDIIMREIAHADGADQKVELYKEAAKIATDRMRQTDVATDLWEQALDISPGDMDALKALETIHERAKDWEALAEVSERKLDVLDDDKETVKLAEKLGRIYSDRLSNTDKAIASWRRVLAVDPTNRKANDALKKLLVEVQDWDALEAIYAQQDDYKGLVRSFETLARSVQDDEAKVDLLIRTGVVWKTHHNQPDRALRALESVLEIDPNNLRAARELVPIYRDRKDSQKLSNSLEVILAHLDPQESPDDVRETLLVMAELKEGQLEAPDEAFSYYAQAFALTPLVVRTPPAEDAPEGTPDAVEPNPAAFGSFERVAGQLNMWDIVSGVYMDRLDALQAQGDTVSERELRLRIGHILHQQLEQPEEALEQYEAVLAEFPEEPRALDAQEVLFETLGEWSRLVDVYDQKLALVGDNHDERTRLLLAKAAVLEAQHNDLQGAVDCYRAVLEIEPNHRHALRELTRLYDALDDYTALASNLRQEIELVQATPVQNFTSVDGEPVDEETAAAHSLLQPEASLGELVTLKTRLGEVSAHELTEEGTNEESFAALADVLALNPSNERAVATMEALGDHPDFEQKVANTLEPVYLKSENWESLVQARETQLRFIDPEDTDAQHAKLLSIGSVLLENVLDPERALDAYGRAQRIKPADSVARERLFHICDAVGSWGDFVQLQEDIALDIEDPKLLHQYKTDIATNVEKHLEDPMRAQDVWREVLALDENDEVALSHLEHLTMEGQQWDDLLDVYRRQLTIAQNRLAQAEEGTPQAQDAKEEVENLRFSIASVHEHMLDDAPSAIEIYREILTESPKNVRAAQAMDELLTAEGRFDELAESLTQQLAITDDREEVLHIKCRLANLEHKQRGNAQHAIDLYAEVLGEDPQNEGALGALERLIEVEPDFRVKIVDVLDPLHESAQRWNKFIANQEIRLDESEDPNERIALLHKIAHVQENKLEAPEDAFPTMSRALREDVTHDATMQELYRLAEATMAWDALVDVFETEATIAPNTDVEASLNMRIAALQENHLGDITSTIEHYRRVLELDPQHIDAVNNLERIFLALEEWEPLVQILLDKVELTESEEGKRDLYLRAAARYKNDLQDPQRAIEMNRNVLDLDPANPAAIDDLESLYLEGQLWQELIDLYRRKIEHANNDDERRELYFVIGSLYEGELMSQEDAIDTYKAILELNPEDVQALESLDRLYEATEQWPELEETLKREIELASDEEAAFNLRYRVGRLHEEHLYDPAGAIALYEEILKENPAHSPTVEALEEMVESNVERATASRVLEPIYRGSEQWAKLIQTYLILDEESMDPERQAELRREIGRLYEEHLDHPDQELWTSGRYYAFISYGRVLEVAPEDTNVSDTLERLAADLGIWDELVNLLDERLIGVSDPDAALEMNARLGRILEENVEDYDRAIERYETVRQMDPANLPALIALDRLYEAQGASEQQAEVRRERILNTEDPAERTALRYSLGNLYLSGLEDESSAIATFESILVDDPDNADAHTALESMFEAGYAPMQISSILEPRYREREQWEPLIGLYMRMLNHEEEPHERFERYRQIGEIYQHHHPDPQQAFYAYGNALCEQPGEIEIADQMESMAAELGLWEDLGAFYSGANEATEDPVEKQQILSRLARVLDTHLNDIGQAENAYLQVLTLDDQDEGALKALDRIYLQTENWMDLSGILQRELELSTDDEASIALNYRLGQVFEHHLQEPQRAIDAYRDLLMIDPDHSDALAALERLYISQELWDDLYDVYGAQARLLDENPTQQAEVLSNMADLADNFLSRPGDSIDLWNQVLERLPNDSHAMRSLGFLYEREGMFGDLVQNIEARIELTSDTDEQIELLSKLGRVQREHIYDEEMSIQAWQRVQALDPDNVEALSALRDLYQINSRFDDLVQVLDRMIMLESMTPEQLLDLYAQQGEIHEILEHNDEAITAWRSMLEVDPYNSRALEHLEPLYTDKLDWESVVWVLQRKVEGLAQGEDDAEGFMRIDLLTRISEMWEHQLQNRDQATAATEQILEIEPGNMEASARLEMLLTQAGEEGDDAAWGRLADLYMGRWEQLEDPFERLDTLKRAAVVYETRLNDPTNALYSLCAGFQENPTNAGLAEDLERLARQTGEWETLITVYSGALEEMEDPQDTIPVLLQIGHWFHKELNLLDNAIAHYQQVLAIEPANTQALLSMAEIYESTNHWQALIQVLVHHAQNEQDVTVRIELFRKLGEVYHQHLNNVAEAVNAYNQLLTLDENDVKALEALERIYEDAQQWDALVQVLDRKANSLFEEDQVVQARFRIANLWESNLNDPEQAIEAYRDVLQVDQGHGPSMDALERLYTQLGRSDDLIDIYDLRLALSQDPTEQVMVYLNSAQVHEAQGAKERSVSAYRNVLDIDANNIQALTELERLYQELEEWDYLTETLEQHIAADPSPDTRVGLLHIKAAVYRDCLHDPYQSIQAYNRVLELDANNVESYAELSSLYETVSDWEKCLETLGHYKNLTNDVEKKVELSHKMGVIYQENYLEEDKAEALYREALDMDPSFAPAIEALAGIYEQRSDWPGVILMLKQQEQNTKNLQEKSRILFNIGDIYENRLRDNERAREYYEQSAVFDPENVEVAQPLANMYLAEGRWERAEPLLDLVARLRGHDRSNENLNLLYYNLGRCREELGQPDLALDDYRQAYDLDPVHMGTLQGLGRLLYRRNDYDRAFKIFQSITVNHRDSLSEVELADMYLKCGEIKHKMGEHLYAQQMYEKALAIQPANEKSVQSLIELHEAQENWEHVIDYKLRLVQSSEDDVVRFSLLSDIGDLWRNQLGNGRRAVEAYNAALEIKPDSVATMRQLLDLYTRGRMWPQAIQTLLRLTEQPSETKRVPTYFYTIAVIYRDELGEIQTAVDSFNRALDADPMMLKAFEAIDRLLTANRSWEQLERAYRKMLHRTKDLEETSEVHGLKILLWKNLGEIYRTRRNNYEAAVASYKIASDLVPDDEQLHEILADLYIKTGGHENAITEHKKLLKNNPFRVESYRALFKSYMKLGLYDQAWCMASALCFMEQAEAEQEDFYNRYLQQSLQPARRQLTSDHWKVLTHKSQDALTSQIMAIIAPNMRSYYAKTYKIWGVHKRKDLLDLSKETPFCKIFSYIASTVAVNPVPGVFIKRDGQITGMCNGNLDPPKFIAGPDMFSGRTDREQAYIIGRNLALARPEHYLSGGFFPTANLTAFFLAAMQLTRPTMNIAQGQESIIEIAREMNKIPGPVLMQMRGYVERFFSTGKNPNLSAWRKGVDHTTARVGMLLCGDLRTAANCVQSDQVPVSKLSPKDKIKEMIIFWISDEHFKLRKELGLALGS